MAVLYDFCTAGTGRNGFHLTRLPDGWEKVASSQEEILLEAEGPGGILMTLTCQEGEVSQGQWNLSLYEDSECDDLGESIAETLENGGY